METFSERFERLRVAHGFTRRSLAESLGISHASIVRIGRGEFRPRADMIQPLARRLHVSTDYLLTGRETPHIAALHHAIRAQTPHATLLAMVERQERGR